MYTWYLFLASAIGALAGVQRIDITIKVFLNCIICGWLFLYIHCVATQDIGFEEDKINKPFRPYPQSIADLRYAKIRLGIIISAYIGISYFLDIILPAIVWSILVIWYNYKGGHRTGFVRLLYLAIGCSSIYYTPWICVTRYLPSTSLIVAHQWFPLVDYVTIIASIFQDFRDIEGDAKIGRVTYPIKYGVKCRVFIASLILITPLLILVLFFWFFEGKLQILQLSYWMLFVIACWCLAYKLMYKRNPTSDSFAFKSWGFLSGLVFAAPVFLVS